MTFHNPVFIHHSLGNNFDENLRFTFQIMFPDLIHRPWSTTQSSSVWIMPGFFSDSPSLRSVISAAQLKISTTYETDGMPDIWLLFLWNFKLFSQFFDLPQIEIEDWHEVSLYPCLNFSDPGKKGSTFDCYQCYLVLANLICHGLLGYICFELTIHNIENTAILCVWGRIYFLFLRFMRGL